MDFSHSDRAKALQARVTAFMDEFVYAAEALFESETQAARAAGKPWQPAPVMRHLPVFGHDDSPHGHAEVDFRNMHARTSR